jgi:hypothetical protein
VPQLRDGDRRRQDLIDDPPYHFPCLRLGPILKIEGIYIGVRAYQQHREKGLCLFLSLPQRGAVLTERLVVDNHQVEVAAGDSSIVARERLVLFLLV